MGYNEKKGHWPLMKPKARQPGKSEEDSGDSASEKDAQFEYSKKTTGSGRDVTTEVQSVITVSGAHRRQQGLAYTEWALCLIGRG
ncbi:MAG: hypothetical protein Q9220_004309 [cf. Caloplaca sp. 1 TL-2023]